MANKNLEYALYYASIGWNVFPVYEMEGDKCSCGRTDCNSQGKHPRLRDGLTSATTDETLINGWWTVFPNANIGVRTGEISGFLVVDIDGEGELPEKMPSTVCQTTGSGGQHLLYKYPNDGLKYKSGTHIFPSVDSRADGGYIVVSPSNHKSGDNYTWDIAPNEIDMEDAPSFWLDKIRFIERSIEHNGDEITIESDDRIASMLKVISPDCDYDTWVKIGMAIHSGTEGGGFNLWNDWSMKGDKYDGYETLRIKWGSFGGGSITISTLHHFARENNWIDENLEIGKAAAHAIFKSEQMKIAEKVLASDEKIKIKTPKSIYPKTGLIKTIIDYINDTAIRPLPESSLAAAIALVAILSARKFTLSHQDTSSCLYLVLVARTGAGKEHARSVINKILTAIGASELESGTPASSSGLLGQLSKTPASIFRIDELGLFLKKILSPKSSHFVTDISSIFLECFGSSNGGTILTSVFADRDKNPSKTILSPSPVILGATTASTFYGGLNSGDISSGLLNRFIVFDTQDAKRPFTENEPKPIPKEILDKCKLLHDFKPNSGNLNGIIGLEFHNIETPSDVKEAMYTFREWVDSNSIDETTDDMYSRTAESMQRLAMISAISRDVISPKLELCDVEWAIEVITWSTNMFINQIKDNVSDSDDHKKMNNIIKIVKKSGSKGIVHGVVLRKSTLTAIDFKKYMDTLIQQDLIIVSQEPSATKIATRYFYAGGDL